MPNGIRNTFETRLTHPAKWVICESRLSCI